MHITQTNNTVTFSEYWKMWEDWHECRRRQYDEDQWSNETAWKRKSKKMDQADVECCACVKGKTWLGCVPGDKRGIKMRHTTAWKGLRPRTKLWPCEQIWQRDRVRAYIFLFLQVEWLAYRKRKQEGGHVWLQCHITHDQQHHKVQNSWLELQTQGPHDRACWWNQGERDGEDEGRRDTLLAV